MDGRKHSLMGEPHDSRAETPPAGAEALVRSFNQALIRSLQQRLGSYEDARDVAQEAYARLLNLGQEQTASYHRALLFKIAQNLATDMLRRRAYTELPEPDDLGLWPDPASDPERSLRATRILEQLPALLAELPPNCAEAFRLVRFRQYSFREAAERLGVTERMVRIYLAKALALCQSRLDGIGEEGR
ncbi:sigma-70 family RNA polymerase sigma factor [Stenotrophomonas sp. MYb238]|uniref:RNA polymerase sigma factor n=1 Tax=Stenotrophomonas sp. MYb238 TaxID=2040281 RepID=UPI0012915395|nr:sigma-70 family RNA polymerase sigma factor [Stenotrophomonas sp. MYb238]MQP77768.1 sigma-70 family RNA polymerase sigma factor [Stenotrophomonas sp. MYb238]